MYKVTTLFLYIGRMNDNRRISKCQEDIPLLHNYGVVPNGDECKKYRTPNIDKYQQNEVEQIHILDTHYFAIKG